MNTFKSIFLHFCLIFLNFSPLFSQTRTIDVNGTQREYIIDIPDSYDGLQAYSLLLAYHGMTSNASAIRSYSGFSDYSVQYKYITVYPQGLEDIENVFIPGTQTTGWKFDVSDNRDVEFTEVLLDSLFNEFNLTEEGVYITGMSNGGFISDIIACNIGDRLSAIAPVCGGMGFGSNSCPVTENLPVLHIGSEHDGIVPISSLRAATDFWIEHNGASLTPQSEGFCDVYGSGSTEVRHCEFTCIIDGSPAQTDSYECHTWPSAYSGYDFSATEMVLNFFESHGLGSSEAGIIFSDVKSSGKREISVSHHTPSNKLNIKLGTIQNSRIEISVYDCRGRLIMCSEQNNRASDIKNIFSFSTDNLTEGIYFAAVSINNKIYTDKFMISN